MKKIFKIVSPAKFAAFMKKLKQVDKSVVLEMEDTRLFCKVRSSDKSVVKCVTIPINDFLDSPVEIPVEKRIKMGVLDINKMVDAFRYFDPKDEIYLSMELSEKPGELITGDLELFSESIRIKHRSADISLLNYIEDERQKLAHSTESSVLSFPITKEIFHKLALLSGMENNDQEILHFELQESGMVIKGNSFSFNAIKLDQIDGDKAPATYSIYKNQFGSVDQEVSRMYIHDNRILIVSEESDSIIAIGLVEI
jgi:hypothetical protein